MAVQETIEEHKSPETQGQKPHKRYEWSPTTDGRHKSSTEIERDIDRTRHDMDSTLDRLGNRAHPKRLIDYVADLLQHGGTREQTGRVVREVADSVGSTMRDSPLAAVVAGAGIGWVAWTAQRHDGRVARDTFVKTRDGVTRARRKAGERGAQTAEKLAHARGRAGEYRARAREQYRHARNKTEEYRAKTGDQAEHVRDEIGHRMHQARDTYEQGRDTTQRLIQEQPLVVGIAAMAAGILTGLAFPPTHVESEAMGGASATAREQAAEAAAGAAETVKEKVSEMVEQPGENTAPTASEHTPPSTPGQQAGSSPATEKKAQENRPRT